MGVLSMQPALVVALTLLLVMLPITSAKASQERVLLNATIWVMPDEVYRVCLDVPPGRLVATAHLVPENGQAATEAVDVRIARYSGRPDAPDVTLVASALGATRAAPVISGLYCLMLNHRIPPQPGVPSPSHPQLVAVRITIAPS